MKKTLVLTLLVLLGSVFICNSFTAVFSPVLASPFSSSPLVGDSWNAKTSMSQARGGLGVVALDGKIYAIGGKTVEGFVGTNECYDPKTDTWTILEFMPTSRAYFAAVAYQGKIYCIGGLSKDGACSVNEVYDDALDSWSTKASLPIKVQNLQGHLIDGKIFVTVGYNLFMYDPLTDIWVQKSGIPQNFLAGSDFLASAVVDNTIIVTGKSNMVIYDSSTDVWREGVKPPSELSSGVSGATTGVCAPKKVYTIGAITTKEEWWRYGQKEQGQEGQITPGYVTSIVPVVLVYDPVKGAWSKANVGLNRVDFGIAVFDDTLYVIGGYQIVMGETVVTVDVSEFVVGATYWGEYRTVSQQFVAQESVVGAPCAFNRQYVPVGYSAAVPSVMGVPEATDVGRFEFSQSILLIAISALIVSVAAVGVFFFSQKRHT